jgi:hypothetical protein
LLAQNQVRDKWNKARAGKNARNENKVDVISGGFDSRRCEDPKQRTPSRTSEVRWDFLGTS